MKKRRKGRVKVLTKIHHIVKENLEVTRRNSFLEGDNFSKGLFNRFEIDAETFRRLANIIFPAADWFPNIPLSLAYLHGAAALVVTRMRSCEVTTRSLEQMSIRRVTHYG